MSISDTLGGFHPRAVRADAGASADCEIVDLLAVPEAAWRCLADRAAEPNAFLHPAWARAVARHAEGKGGARVLLVWDGPARRSLIGLLPVVSAWHALRLPLPALVAWHAYAPLATPLLDRDRIEDAARGLVEAARKAGAYALVMPSLAPDGPTGAALTRACSPFGAALSFNAHERALLDAAQDPDAALQPLGAKKLKELRRQRNRLADGGEVRFEIVSDEIRVRPALDAFLMLEAAGWKGARGTALARKAGDEAFLREAVTTLVADGAAEVATLICGDRMVAAGVVLRHLRRGYFFKIAYDETLAKTSPGVQLTLDITRRLCADPATDDADSIAVAGHPMIDHVWRGRLPVCDRVLPLGHDTAAFHVIARAISLRHTLRGVARRALHSVRSLKGSRP